MRFWDDFEYYDFDVLTEVTANRASKPLLRQDEFQSELVEFHKTAPRYQGPLSMIGVRIGVSLKLVFWG